MVEKRILILNSGQIKEKITRIAYQIREDSFEENQLVLAGIADRGYIIAKRLKEELIRISSELSVELIKINLDKESSILRAETDRALVEAENKVVILIDDVLNSGRAIAYGLGVFLNIPLKKMRTAVLIDRSHRKFPVESDFVGLKLSTVLNEHVSVSLIEFDGEDAVYLI